jgi:hypothetical protein
MELCDFYNLTECENIRKVLKEIGKYEKELKLECEYDKGTDIIKITDLDMTEEDIEKLVSFFDFNNVFEDSEGFTSGDYYNESDDEDDDNDGY